MSFVPEWMWSSSGLLLRKPHPDSSRTLRLRKRRTRIQIRQSRRRRCQLLLATFCPMEKLAMLRAVGEIVNLSGTGPVVASAYGLTYPAERTSNG